jgi:hypothetical protein
MLSVAIRACDAIRLLLTARTCRKDAHGNAAVASSMHAPLRTCTELQLCPAGLKLGSCMHR